MTSTIETGAVGSWLSVRWMDPNPEALAVGYLTYCMTPDWRARASLYELSLTLKRCA